MAIEVLIKIERTTENGQIDDGDVVTLSGSGGKATGKVFLHVAPSLPNDNDVIFLHVRMAKDTHWMSVEGVNVLQVFDRGMLKVPVLSISRLK